LHKINDDYFEVINDSRKAYWLGLMYADGCVYNCKSKPFNIELSLIDKDIIEKLKEDLEFEGLIHTRIYKNPAYSNAYKLSFKSEKMFKDLERLGCIERKSLVLTFPDEKLLNKIFIPYFIRGYFDGDGSVYSNNYGKSKVVLTGTFSFISSIKEYLNLNNINCSIRQHNNVFNLIIGGINHILRFKELMYSDNNELFLVRKRLKFNLLQKLYNEVQERKLFVRKCSLEDCNEKHLSRGYCAKHYHINITKFAQSK